MTATEDHPPRARGNAERQRVFALLAENRAGFLTFLRRRSAPGTDVEDLLQRALLLAVQKLEQLQQPERVLGWFHTILRRVLADHRDAHAQRAAALARYAGEAASGRSETPVRCTCSLELAKTLAPQYAEVLRRIDIEEEAVPAVARALGTTRGNVAVRLHRARLALRARLSEVCATTSAAGCLDCRCGECAAIGPMAGAV